MCIIAPTTNQRTCNIISTSLPTVTTPSGVIANGTEDVILYCICLTNDDDIAVGPTRWFIDNTEVTDDLPNGNNPYFRNNVPSPLIIPMFGASNVGTYRCGSDNTIAAPDDDRITLTLACMYLCVSILKQNIYVCMCTIHCNSSRNQYEIIGLCKISHPISHLVVVFI